MRVCLDLSGHQPSAVIPEIRLIIKTHYNISCKSQEGHNSAVDRHTHTRTHAHTHTHAHARTHARTHTDTHLMTVQLASVALLLLSYSTYYVWR